MVAPSSPPLRTLRDTLFEPILRVPEATRRRWLVTFLVLAAALFPMIDSNDGDIDAAANATAFATLALGLNIVVGFAGLLDLGYAAFFAIGAYSYGILSSYQVAPLWSEFWEPFQWLGLVAQLKVAGEPDVVHFTVSFWLMLPISGLLGVVIERVALRSVRQLRGTAPMILTIGIS